ncbi:MAG: restriction endonuclease [Chthonomonadetes bacterium]|nr:restriction endonuclease [Chthonomonadetes bacterium]
MDYSRFCEIMNVCIFEHGKRDLLEKIAESPERFLGLFRPSKPETKILQNLLQSHEIRFGRALEQFIENLVEDMGFSNLPKIIHVGEEKLSLDQFFTDGSTCFFIEQKIRDDHDSSKKRGQIDNFRKKLAYLSVHYSPLTGIMYFVDPSLAKNRVYYESELKQLEESYGVPLHLFYGKDIFAFLGKPEYWDMMIDWLKRWKEDIPMIPEIDFDSNPEKSFWEIKDLPVSRWQKILQKDELWEQGIIKVLFRRGATLTRLAEYFLARQESEYQEVGKLLQERVERYYRSV